MTQEKALVLFSGGQDSATCLAWALDRFAAVETIGFDYGQRHRIELDIRDGFRTALLRARPEWQAKLGTDHLIRLDTLGQVSDTALTSEATIAFNADGLPNTFVPGRNIIFLSFAAAIAYRRGIKHIVAGVCETDYSGYPDCRPAFIAAFQALAEVATKAAVEGESLRIEAPLIALSKAEIIARGMALGVDFSLTVSCYQADAEGRACGDCDACHFRREGFHAAGVADPTRYVS